MTATFNKYCNQQQRCSYSITPHNIFLLICSLKNFTENYLSKYNNKVSDILQTQWLLLFIKLLVIHYRKHMPGPSKKGGTDHIEFYQSQTATDSLS